MNTPDHATAKIAKLIPLLGSDQSGEVAAAAGAIGRILCEHDCDWHDVAAAVERGWAAPEIEHAHASMHHAWWQRTAQTCLQAGGYSLKLGEQEFLQSMLHWPSHPNEKQCRWLEAIAAALNIRCAA